MTDLSYLETLAIDAAIAVRFEDAIKYNLEILKVDKENIDALLRLGFAYLQLKMLKESKRYYQKALKIQPKNRVALENLEKIQIFHDEGSKRVVKNRGSLNPNLFLEIPGKTKSVVLVNLGQKKHLAELIVGQEVELKLKKRKVEVRTYADSYIGSLPDDLSKRLIFFLKSKSEYSAYVKEASLSKIVIYVQELKKGSKVSHFVSFPTNIQSNMTGLASAEEGPEMEDDAGNDEDEWEKLVAELATSEEKADLGDIHSEAEAEEDEE